VSKKPNCKDITYRATKNKGLNYVDEYSEFWHFAGNWIKRSRRSGNEMSKFIHLWVSFNAWASMVVPDITKNHLDMYVVSSIAAAKRFNNRFETLIEEDDLFRNQVNKFVPLLPVFQVLWLNNNNIDSWNNYEDRRQFVDSVRERNPYSKDGYKMFSPPCAYEHFDMGEEIPQDWPHVMNAIYRVRCNLFHGGKMFNSPADRQFVNLTYDILWSVWKGFIPEHLRQK